MYIICALYDEAAPIITYYGLQKEVSFTKFQVFRNKEISLIISNPGCLNSSIATTYLLSKFPPSTNDFIVNIGVCGCSDSQIPLSTVYLVHKITDASTDFTFYPDILFTHSFPTQMVTTVAKPLDAACPLDITGLIDMEASGFYSAASCFFQPHQIILFKIVSDYCQSSFTTRRSIRSYIEGFLPAFTQWSSQISISDNAACTSEYETAFMRILPEFKLSVTLQHEFEQFFHYYLLEYQDASALINQLERDSTKIKTKAEGKKYFEELRRSFIS